MAIPLCGWFSSDFAGEKLLAVVAVEQDGPFVAGFDDAEWIAAAGHMREDGPAVRPLFDQQIVVLALQVQDDPQVARRLLYHDFRRLRSIHVIGGVCVLDCGKDEGYRSRLAVRHGIETNVIVRLHSIPPVASASLAPVLGNALLLFNQRTDRLRRLRRAHFPAQIFKLLGQPAVVDGGGDLAGKIMD